MVRAVSPTALAVRAALCGVLAGCSSAQPATTAGDASTVPDGWTPYSAKCVGAAVPPTTIECTGLYENVATRTIAPGIRAYAPAVPLWSDFAEKKRWIWLPPATKIDATDPNDWIFPVGTKLFKEFARDGRRVETRMWQKVKDGYWVRATYAWNAAETEATSAPGGDIPWSSDGGVYHIPTGDECDQCHHGRTDNILGFEAVSLGLDGATGLTLAQLVAEKLITPVPASTKLTVGDDGTGVAAPALKWLHINCGVPCHNDNSNSTAYGSNMRLRLDPTLLDGRPSTSFPARETTMGMLANNPMWNTEPRITPGDPAQSLLVKLITSRGTNNPAANQMPPIASNIVDETDTPLVIDWISKMTPIGDGG
jgi:hypothetical protein